MSLSGTHTKKEPLVGKDSDEVTVSALCSFLYIVDILTFRRTTKEILMYEKPPFIHMLMRNNIVFLAKMCYNLFELDLIRFIRVNPDEKLPRLPMPR